MKCYSGLLKTKHSCSIFALSSARQISSGFSLIEVLISIIILSFGLLGMVGLQAASLQANRDARLQSVAASLGRELAEMMRGNKAIAIKADNPYVGQYSNPNGTTPLTHKSPSYCLNANDLPTSKCVNTTDIASAEMTNWLAKVDAALPGAKVEVCTDPTPYDLSGLPNWSDCDATGGGTLVIKIGWTRNTTNKDDTGDKAFNRAVRPSVVYVVTAGSA